MNPPDLSKLSALKHQIDQFKDQQKKAKAEVDVMEAQCVQLLIQMGKRYVDESGNGNGPFWSLSKSKSDGSWNADRYTEFFTTLLTDMHQGKVYSPAQIAEHAVQYLKQFEKRKLVLVKLSKKGQEGIGDLSAWVSGQGQ